GVMMVQGVATDAPVIGEIKPLPQGAGDLRAGDRILSVGGIETPGYDDLFAAADRIEPAPLVPYELDRDGQRLDGQGPFPMPPIVDAVQPRSAAADAGLRPGDVIVRVDGQPVYAFRQVREIVTNGDGRPLRLGIWRQGAELQVVLAPRRVDLPLPEGGFETRWLIGISGGLFFEPETRRAGPFEALRFGVEQTGFIIRSSLSGLVHMISGAISSCNLSGPVGIAETSGQAARAGLGSFVWFIGVLSAAIGLLNLFPIPVLDGGHLVFYAWEGLTGRPPSDQVVRFLMAIGMALILTMMIFAMANDLFLCP
ncbi:MAG: RIP metalloprotease RseP, partial [Alphaproteobacteria bacterium]